MATIQNGQVILDQNETPIQGTPTGSFVTSNGLNYSVNPSAIAVDTLKSNPSALKLPSIPSPYAYSALGGYVDSISSQNTAKQQADMQALDQAKKAENEKLALASSRQSLTDKILGAPTKSLLEAKAYDETNSLGTTVNTANQDILDIRNQALALDASARKEAEKIRSSGATKAGVSDALGELERKVNSQKADLAIIENVKLNNYSIAKQIADIKVEADLEKSKNEIEALRISYQDNKDSFTKDEQRSYEQMLSKRDRELKNEEADKKMISDLSLNAAENGAPTDLVVRLRQANTVDEALAIGGQYINKYDRIYKQAQVDKLKAEASNQKKSNQAILNVSRVDPTSQNYIQNLLTASAGGENLTGDQTKPISKALTVVGQIDSLTNTLKSTDTGPILGIFKSNNPYDVKASLIKAQLQALVPNLARGVYGEVGVLTDQDIQNYSRTIGSLRTPSQINDLLTSITLKTIKKGIDDQLEVFASAGRDVSGFVNLYNRLDDKIKGIDSKIGLTQDQQNALNGNPFKESITKTTVPIYSSQTGQFIIPNN